MIQLPSYPEVSSDYDYDIELDGKIVNLRFTWNVRSEFWHFLLTIDSVQYGRFKVTNDFPLLGAAANSIPFSGNFFVFKDDASATAEITYDNLGTVYNLYYLTAAETEEWKTQNGI